MTNYAEKVRNIRDNIASDGVLCSHCGKRLLKKNGRPYVKRCRWHDFNIGLEIMKENEKPITEIKK